VPQWFLASDRVHGVFSRWFDGAVFLCSATLHACQTMYRPKQFCAWHATSETEIHPSQTGADRGVVLPLPGCTRFVQTVACQLEMPSTVPRIGPCGERTLRPPRPCVEDDDDDTHYWSASEVLISILQALRPQVVRPHRFVTHGQCHARPSVTFPAATRHCPLTGTKLN